MNLEILQTPTLAPEIRRVESVKLAIANSLGQYLLLTRAATDANRPGTADLPGGGVDDGESPRQACLREAYEELGLRLRYDQLGEAHYCERPSSYGHVNVRHFLHVLLTEEQPNLTLNPAEHSALQWLPRVETYERLIHPPLREGFALATGLVGLDRL